MTSGGQNPRLSASSSCKQPCCSFSTLPASKYKLSCGTVTAPALWRLLRITGSCPPHLCHTTTCQTLAHPAAVMTTRHAGMQSTAMLPVASMLLRVGLLRVGPTSSRSQAWKCLLPSQPAAACSTWTSAKQCCSSTQHMFPAGRTLLQLTCLQAPHALYHPEDDYPAESDLALTDADVEAMVSCCPALQALDAARVLHLSDKPHLGTLQHLTRLQAIWGGDSYTAWDSSGDGEYMDIWERVDKAAAARELSKLANLQHLKLRGTGQWGECLFRALQQLNHLTRLCLSGINRACGRLSDGEAGLIAHLTSLQELDVQDCWLQEAQLLQLASLPQLTRLCFTPAADMSTVFAQAVKSFKGSSDLSDRRRIPHRVCIIESKVSPAWYLSCTILQSCRSYIAEHMRYISSHAASH